MKCRQSSDGALQLLFGGFDRFLPFRVRHGVTHLRPTQHSEVHTGPVAFDQTSCSLRFSQGQSKSWRIAAPHGILHPVLHEPRGRAVPNVIGNSLSAEPEPLLAQDLPGRPQATRATQAAQAGAKKAGTALVSKQTNWNIWTCTLQHQQLCA